ncbi:MAG: peptide chain release factor-like protein [Sedimentisphaerales bacterium]|jgi:protein subunit release factor B|nr:peptide chain release factor-like protein [Sedimentisphaerales bacterium]
MQRRDSSRLDLPRFGVTQQKARLLAERMALLGICEQDLDEQFVRSSGPGGQHLNKTSTCVVLTHLPTGIIVKSQQARSQALNRYYARKRLCELIEARLLGKESPQALKADKIRRQKDRRRRRRMAKKALSSGPECQRQQD